MHLAMSTPPSVPPSPGPGESGGLRDQDRLSGSVAHNSPKGDLANFAGDGIGHGNELQNPKTKAHKNVPVVGAGDWSPGSRALLGHISLGVKDYDRAKIFFSALRCLGLKLVYDSEEKGPSSGTRILGYGPDAVHELLNIFEYGEQAHAPGRGCHVAFNAPSREAVDEFHAQALFNGGSCEGKPGVRARYGPNYYAAFVMSPDGWKLEAVCKNPE